MYYPIWDVPVLTAPMVIAVVALVHVFISHYAVGGGLLLARENSRALRNGEGAYREYWKKHAKFFILLTVPLGAITGVGIWFTIGLASPLATETLIRVFAFGWAIEWCFFLLEIVAGFALYYFWDKFSPRVSSFAGWVYGLSAWISLVLITGITSFMLNSTGLIGDWESTGNFWHAFLNVQFLPQTVARTGCALTLGSLYVLAHATLVEKNLDVRELVVKRMRLPAFLGILLVAAGVAGWAYFLPESSRLTIERAAATNIFAGLFVAILVGLVLLLIAGPCAKPRETTFGGALAMALMGIAAVGVAEFVREAARKPYVVDRVVYGSQIQREDVAKLRQTGYLYCGVWTVLELDKLQESYPDLAISAERYLGVPTLHLEPPAYVQRAKPAQDDLEETLEPNGENNGESEGNESLVSPPPPETSDLLGVEKTRTAYYMQTVAYQQSLGDSRFAPTSTQSPRLSSHALESAASPASAPQTGLTNAAQPANANLSTPAATSANVAASSQPAAQPESRVARSSALDERVVSDPQGVAEREQPVVATPAPLAEPDASDRAGDVEPASTKTSAELDLEINGSIARGNEDLLKVSREDRLALGRMMFLYHCNSCHASNHGYSALGPMTSGLTEREIADFALTLNHTHFYMPPWAGTEVEAELLAEYVATISAKTPNNVFMKSKPKKPAPKPETQTDAEADADEAFETAAPKGSDELSELPSGLGAL